MYSDHVFKKAGSCERVASDPGPEKAGTPFFRAFECLVIESQDLEGKTAWAYGNRLKLLSLLVIICRADMVVR